MAHTMTIDYGDDLLLSVGMSPSEFASEAKFLLAAKLYEMGRLTSGQAAKLCGRGRLDFLLCLPRVGVCVSNLGAEDGDEEIAFARNA